MSWQQVKIGSFLKRIKRPVEINDSGIYKRVTISSNHNGIKLRDTEIGAAIGTKNQFIVNEGDFILSKIDAMNGAFGIISSEVDEAIITGNFWAYNVDKDKVDSEWFLYFTHSMAFIDICKKSSTGTTHRKYLDEKIFLSYKLFLPDIDTQKKQVATFQNLNHHTNIIAKEVSRQREYLAKLKQSILQDAICGKLTEDWREANPNIEPASELLKRIKAEKQQQIKEGKIRKDKPIDPISDTDLPFTIPPTWQWCRLGDLCIKTGSGSTPSGGKSAYPSEGIYFLRSQNVYNSGIVLDGVAFISDKTHQIMSGTKVKQRDLLLNITGGSIGRCAIVPKGFDEANINQHVAIIRLLDVDMGEFVHSVIISDYFQKMIVDAQTGAGREGLPKNKMDKILIPIPPQEEQKRIVEIIKNGIEKCSLIEAQITANEQTAQNLIKSILSETFNNN